MPRSINRKEHYYLGDGVQMSIPFDKLTDLAINTSNPSKSIAFPGPVKVENTHLEALCIALAKECKDTQTGHDEFTHEHEGMFFRGHWDRSVVDGHWVRLRKQRGDPPNLNALPSPLPFQIIDHLLAPELSPGGLVLVMGAPGSGKTTTASAMVVSRLRKFGGMAYTVEDPPEHPLNGWHGNGYCAQTSVVGADKDAEAWAKSLKGALRSQPAATPSILFVGEIREKGAAEIALQAAGNGFLVIATAFGADIPSGLDDFAKKVGPDKYFLLSSRFRMALHMQLMGEIPKVQMMISTENSSLAAMIRGGKFGQVESELNVQRNNLRLGVNLWRPEQLRVT